jgi:tRNA pseudouridine55 synthase
VTIVRRATGAKTGHAGTLDPFASGVLPIALGEATKTVRFASEARKHYRFTVRWGIATDTEDREGAVVEEAPARPSRDEIIALLPRFTGTIRQRPPAYSALKVDGRRAYALARAGKPPELAPRPIEIFALGLVAIPDPDHAEFSAEVGSGTYVRALARDLAVALGTLGHVTALRRTRVGRFTEALAISLDSLALLGHSPPASEHLLPLEFVLDDIPALVLSADEVARLRHGQQVTPCDPHERAQLDRLDEGTIVGARHDRLLIAVARIEKGCLRPVRVINR